VLFGIFVLGSLFTFIKESILYDFGRSKESRDQVYKVNEKTSTNIDLYNTTFKPTWTEYNTNEKEFTDSFNVPNELQNYPMQQIDKPAVQADPTLMSQNPTKEDQKQESMYSKEDWKGEEESPGTS